VVPRALLSAFVSARFDYKAPAEVFTETRKRRGRPIGYRRFRSAADAIRFAVEELPGTLRSGLCI
jgi:hypothetical protein